MDLVTIDPINITFDDVNFDEDDPKTVIYVRLKAWHNKSKQHKEY